MKCPGTNIMKCPGTNAMKCPGTNIMKCPGLNEIYGKWYTIKNLSLVVCEYCKNEYNESHQVFAHEYLNTCDGYKIKQNFTIKDSGFDISIWDYTLYNPFNIADNVIKITPNVTNLIYLYISNNLTMQYFSIIIKQDNDDILNEVENFTIYKSDFITEIIATSDLYIFIYIYDVIPNNILSVSNVNLGDYTYDKKTNMIQLTNARSIAKPKIKYSASSPDIHGQKLACASYWNAESSFKLNSIKEIQLRIT